MHGIENAAQVFPRRRIAVEAMQEQEVAGEARHPADRRAVADDRAHAGRLQELTREGCAALAAEHAAGGEVHEIAIAAAAVASEGFAELLAGDPAEHRRHRGRASVE